MSRPAPPGQGDPAEVDRPLPPHAITCLLDALRSTQEVIRSYDTKAQIMGIIFILSINFILTLIRELIGVGPIPTTATLSLAVLVLLPLGLFGYVLFPANNPKGELELGGQPVRYSYFVDRRGPRLADYLDDVEATDWAAELGFEIMKMARLRERKRRRLLRALVAAGASYVLILAMMLLVAWSAGRPWRVFACLGHGERVRPALAVSGEKRAMNGAERMIEAAVGHGLDVCFANPGTTEMPFVNALDRAQGMAAVLGLHENVCTGAADGYARLAGKPALTLLHLGPGFANGLANLHNARRAYSPVVNLIGEHATWHLAADPPLASEIERLTGWAGRWTRRTAAAEGVVRDMTEAVAAARAGRGGIASLIVPHDIQLADAGAAPAVPLRIEGYPGVAPDLVETAARLLADARRPALLLGGNALFGAGLEAAGQLAAATGASLIAEVGFARLDLGRGRPMVRRLPYFPEQAAALLDGFDVVVVAGTKLPVSFFGYHDKPSRYLEAREGVCHLAAAEENAAAALAALHEALPAAAGRAPADNGSPPAPPAGGAGTGLTPESIGRAVAAAQPEDAIVVVTAVSSAAPYGLHSLQAAPHTQLALTGGAIGEGMAMALGAAVAAPDRRVISLQADGSGAYIMQALWSQARHGARITTVIFANRRYRILEMEQERAGIRPGPIAAELATLDNPPLDWPLIARGLGVQAESVEDTDGLTRALRRGLAEPGPYLIEALM